MWFQNYLAPQLRDKHQFYLDGPEECTPLLMQDFATQALAGLFNVPSYSKWLDTASHNATYRHHKKLLQTLQWKYPADRWLLKSPDHIAAIDTILDYYPDACVIHMHRDPVKSVASWASLNATFRGIYMESVNRGELGLQVLNRLSNDVANYLSKRQRCDESRFLDLRYRELTENPFATVRRIYGKFGLVMSSEANARIQAFLARDRKKKRSHHYNPHEFGLTPQLVQSKFEKYIESFKIDRED